MFRSLTYWAVSMIRFSSESPRAEPLKKLMVIPTQFERDAFIAGLPQFEKTAESLEIGRIQASHIPELDLTVAAGGLGKSQFGVQTQHLIDSTEAWDVVICAGVAGALSDQLEIGDVVVGSETVEHDFFELATGENPRFPGSPDVLQAFRTTSRSDRTFGVHFAGIASGDQTVKTAEKRSELNRSTGAIAVAWEGAGGAKACAFSGAPFVEIRAITDHADSQVSSNIKLNLPLCMRNIASFITDWAKNN